MLLDEHPPGFPTVDLGPDQHRVVVVNWRPSQAAIVAVGVAQLAVLTAAAGAAGVLVGLFVFFVFAAVAAAGLDRSAVPAVRWSVARTRRTHRGHSPVAAWTATATPTPADAAAADGGPDGPQGRPARARVHTLTLTAPDQHPPTHLAGVRILGFGDAAGRARGVVHDPVHNTYAAMIAVDGHRTNRLDHADAAAALDEWQQILAGLSDPGSGIRRFGWITSSAPGPVEQLLGDVAARADPTCPPSVVGSYLDLVADAGPVVEVHDTWLVVQVGGSGLPVSKADRKTGGGAYLPGCRKLAVAVDHARSELAAAGWRTLDDWLSPGAAAAAVRTVHDPWARPELAARQLDDVDSDGGVDVHAAWPDRWEDRFRGYHADGVVHVCGEVEAWPGQPTRADFLRHLILYPAVPRTVAVWFQPEDLERAVGKAERARASAPLFKEAREKFGFTQPRKADSQADHADSYLDELVGGYQPVRVSAWVSAAALADDGPDGADRAWAEVRRAAVGAGIRLRRRNGHHARTFHHLLPLGRGVAEGWG